MIYKYYTRNKIKYDNKLNMSNLNSPSIIISLLVLILISMSCFIKSLFLKHEYFNSEPNKYNVISCEGGTCMNDNNNYYNMPCNQAELPNYLKCSLPCSSIP